MNSETIRECGDTHGVFNFLHMNNIKVAICTCDDRKPTEECLKILNINVKTETNEKETYNDTSKFKDKDKNI